MNLNRRIRNHASSAADQFDATVLHNRVYEQVHGAHTSDPQLRRVIDLAEECYDFADERSAAVGRDDAVHDAAFDAAESLNDVIDDLVDEQIARACEVVIDAAPEWTDHWDEAELKTAAQEAREWLQLNMEAAERAGVLEALEVRQ